MDNAISTYDRIRGGLEGVALFTKPSTIQNVESVTGEAETFIVRTARHRDLGDTDEDRKAEYTIFIECVNKAGQVLRIALPPKVADAIARQRESLSARLRSKIAKEVAEARKARGELPGFMKTTSRRSSRKAKQAQSEAPSV